MWLAWITGLALLAFGGLTVIGNWTMLVALVLGKWRGSFILIFGGVFAFLGCAIVPALGWKVGLIAIALDPGCFLFVVGPIAALIGKLRDRGELM